MKSNRKDFKECPVCAEWIRVKARVCRICGAILTQEPLPEFVPVGQREEEIELKASVEKRFAEMGVDLSERQERRIVEFLKQSEDQYRTATVLFCDLSGYTTLSQVLKAEETKTILDVYYRVFVQAVEFYNGFIVEFAGDGGMAVFGAPVAFGRDAEAALLAAWDIRERIRALPAFGDVKVQISSGLATGEILSTMIRTKSPPHYKLYGHSVNLAARVEGAADPDSILIDHETWNLVKNRFTFHSQGPRRFKNVKEAVATYTVLEKQTQTIETGRAFPFVGREKEQRQIREAWDEFVRDDAEQKPVKRGILIVGEPGIGKTRLVKEGLKAVHDDARMIRVECAPYQTKVPWSLWRLLLRNLADLSESASEESIRTRLDAFLLSHGFQDNDQQALRLLFGLKESVEALASLAPAIIQKLIARDLQLLLARSVETVRMVLILDDLQWTDATSLECLQQLIGDPSLQRVLFVLIHRPDYRLSRDSTRSLYTVRVGPLDADSRRLLFDQMIEEKDIAPEIRDDLIRKAEGNPFYLIELIRTLKESHAAREGGESQDQKVRKAWVPPSLQQLLNARIDTLDQSRKQVLLCASVLGNRFAFQLIDLFEHIRENLLAQLYSLKTLEFLDDIPLPEGLEFFFRHHMTREVTYQSLLSPQRQKLHRIVAEAIENRFSDRPDEVLPLLAYHYSLSGHDERAVHYLVQSGDKATSQGAMTEAHLQYDAALDLLSKQKLSRKNHRQTAQLQRQKGRLFRYAGDMDSALNYFQKALESLEGEKQTRDVIILHTEMGLTHAQWGNYEAARDLLQDSVKRLGRRRDDFLQAKIQNALGICAFGQGRFDAAEAHFRAVSDMRLEKRNPNLSADARNNLALLKWKTGNLPEAEGLFQAALKLFHTSGNRFGICLTLLNLGVIAENRGKLDKAFRRYQEALDVAQRIGYQHAMTAVYSNLGNLSLLLEKPQDALEQSARALEIADRVKDRRSAAIALENMALGNIALKRISDGKTCIQKARRIARTMGDRERLFSLDLVAIELHLMDGNQTRIASLIRRAENDLQTSEFESERPRLLRMKAEHLFTKNKTQEATKALKEGLEVARKQDNKAEERRLTRTKDKFLPHQTS